MRLVHFSDLHLDAPFAWMGAGGEAARRRREAQRTVLARIAALAGERAADALLSAGDLYEQASFTPDTAAFLRQAFAALAPIRVFLAPGNHDPFGLRSLYRTVDWSPNVHVFTEQRLEPVALADGVTLWGAAHLGPAITTNFLEGFRVRGDGVHLALFHGAERGWLTEQEPGKAPHAPFSAHEIAAAGLHHAFLGHYHRPRDAERHTYPGNPEPLAFGEDGLRGAVIATVDAEGRVERERVRVAETAVHDVAIDVGGCASRDEVRARVRAQLAGRRGVARVQLVGDLAESVELVAGHVTSVEHELDALQVSLAGIGVAYDFDRIALEATVAGEFVRDVRATVVDPDLQRRVLVTGLRALAGRRDLEVP